LSGWSFPVTFERRLGRVSPWLHVAVPIVAGAVALVIVALVLVLSGNDPIDTYRQMVESAFTSKGAFSATLLASTPLLLTGLAAAFAFRMKAWNIGGEGQLYAGAIAAAGVGLSVGDQGLAVGLPAMVIAGIAGGALWAAIPGVLRAYLHTNEILTSLMLNYVAGLGMYYLIFDSRSHWRDLSSPAAKVFPQGRDIDASLFWPGFQGGDVILPLGFVFGVVLAVVLWAALRYTRAGFQLRVVSDSPSAGAYAGMRTKRVFVTVMLVSGALAGLAGASQVGDFSHDLDPQTLQGAAYGYIGIVAAALARYNPLGVIVTAVFLGGITNAGVRLQGDEFPLGLVGTIQGIILFSVLAGELLARYRIRPRAAALAAARAEENGASAGLSPPVAGVPTASAEREL
jgi:general nucleoside transport system permease protein